MKSTAWRENKASQRSKAKNREGYQTTIPQKKKGKSSNNTSFGRKKENIKIDREEILEYPQGQLPTDAEFKGYEEVIVQDIKLSTDNILFRQQKYYSPSEKKTYLASLPAGYEGEFGPGFIALVISLYYGGNMSLGKLLEFFENIGISISAGHLCHLLIKNHQEFEAEKEEICEAGLSSSPWQHLDLAQCQGGWS